MANYRTAVLLDNKTATTAGTETININLTQKISRFVIAYRGTNSSSTPTAHPAKMVSKIELVDGSDVLYSCSGIEAQAISFYDEGEMPFVMNETENDILCQANFHINFGRRLYDPNLALDPTRYKNLQLKITHNCALGGSACDASAMSVFADVFDGKIVTPTGFLQTKENTTYTLAASGHAYVDLPTDNTLRKIYIMSTSSSNGPSSQVEYVTLSENDGQKVIINNERMRELIKKSPTNFLVKDRFATLGTASAVTYYIAGSYEQYGNGTGRSHSQTTLIVAQPSGVAINVTNDASESVAVQVAGYCPHGCVAIPFGDQTDMMDWYNVSGLNGLKLDLTAGSGASGTCQVITQQLRRY